MKQITKILTAALFALAAGTVSTSAQTTVARGQVAVTKSAVKKNGNEVSLDLSLDLSRARVRAGKGIILTPMLVSGNDTARFRTVEILGRNRYIYYRRNGKTATADPAVVERRHNGKEQSIDYTSTVPYQRWMRSSQLIMAEGDCGCDQTLLSQDTPEPLHNVSVGGPLKFSFAYVQPAPEAVKHRAEEGSARLNFVVDKYDIRPNFGRNAAELKKIRSTIDLVRNDADVELTGIALHGYASPDGRYDHNATLAENRTKALRTYLENYYSKLSPKLFTVASTPEDWDGVTEWLRQCNLKDRDALLSIAEGSLSPDAKDRLMAQRHGDSYRVILRDCYPPLRRTDYKVTYNVRNFNLEEARRIIRERPQKLSLQEMYRVANSYEAGSAEFNHVFNVAVRMFPEDELANLNAANVSLNRGDKVSAECFLKKAGQRPEAVNARGVLAAMNEDYKSARALFNEAAKAGLAQARQNLQTLDDAGE